VSLSSYISAGKQADFTHLKTNTNEVVIEG